MSSRALGLPAGSSPVSDRFFRQIFQSMRNGVLAVTTDGRLTVMNEVAYRILDLAPGPDDVGRLAAEVLHDRPDVVRVLATAFELQHLPNRAELRLKPSGKVIGYTLSHVHDDGGQTLGAALFFKDLTQVEQIEERDRLRDRLAALGEMAATIAHEVKNPLAGIEVMAGLLRRRLSDSAEGQALVGDIISEAKKANAIVQEVLDFVRPIRLQVEHTSIVQVLYDAVTMAERKVSRRDVTVTLNVEEQLPLIQGDQTQLCQLFGNLVINALEALGGAGTISLAAGLRIEEGEPPAAGGPPQPIQMVMVEVVDDGPGIPPEITERVFNPFFTTKPQGSGLGLAIVRKIVDAHDGRIDVSSTPGQGTRFRVMLPLSSRHGWL
ncbi:MAG: PAS domain-containing protein [Acidobacteria bacterium]|nr:PAS domain-containing protein [Acidobacteriota bacterium]